MTIAAERAARDTKRGTIFRQFPRQERQRQEHRRRLEGLRDLPLPPIGRALIGGRQLGLRYDIPARHRKRLPWSRVLPAPIAYDPATQEVLWDFATILEFEIRLRRSNGGCT
jgi:hypothetical protein